MNENLEALLFNQLKHNYILKSFKYFFIKIQFEYHQIWFEEENNKFTYKIKKLSKILQNNYW